MYKKICDLNGKNIPFGITTGWKYLPERGNNRVQVDACLREGAVAKILSLIVYPENINLLFQKGQVNGSDFKPQYSLSWAYDISGTMQGKFTEWCGVNNSTTAHTLPNGVISSMTGITRLYGDKTIYLPTRINPTRILQVVEKRENPFNEVNLRQILQNYELALDTRNQSLP